MARVESLRCARCSFTNGVLSLTRTRASAAHQVQLLSHQTHIATKIELFLSTSSALQDATFQRLGCVSRLFLLCRTHGRVLTRSVCR